MRFKEGRKEPFEYGEKKKQNMVKREGIDEKNKVQVRWKYKR